MSDDMRGFSSLRTVPGGSMLQCKCGYTIKEPSGKEAIAAWKENHSCDFTEAV